MSASFGFTGDATGVARPRSAPCLCGHAANDHEQRWKGRCLVQLPVVRLTITGTEIEETTEPDQPCPCEGYRPKE